MEVACNNEERANSHDIFFLIHFGDFIHVDTAIIKMHAVSKFSPKTREERVRVGEGKRQGKSRTRKKALEYSYLLHWSNHLKRGSAEPYSGTSCGALMLEVGKSPTATTRRTELPVS